MSINSFKSNYFKNCILRFIDYLQIIDCLNPAAVVDVINDVFELSLDIDEVKDYMYKKFPNLISEDGTKNVVNESILKKDLLYELDLISSSNEFDFLNVVDLDELVLKDGDYFIRYHISKSNEKFQLIKSVA